VTRHYITLVASRKTSWNKVRFCYEMLCSLLDYLNLMRTNMQMFSPET